MYDVHAIAHRLGVRRLWQRCCRTANNAADGSVDDPVLMTAREAGQFTTSEEAALSVLWAVSMANCAFSLADAQLGLLRAWKEFMEVGCVRPKSLTSPGAGAPGASRLASTLTTASGASAASADGSQGMRTSAIMAKKLAQTLHEQRGEGNLVTEAMVEIAQLLASMLYHQLHVVLE